MYFIMDNANQFLFVEAVNSITQQQINVMIAQLDAPLVQAVLTALNAMFLNIK